MKIYNEISLKELDMWAGAVDTKNMLTDDELDMIEKTLEGLNHEMSETEVNDFFWFETDVIADWLGYADWDELLEDRKKEED